MTATASLALNKLCPWSGDPVVEEAMTMYRGYKVGFCNTGCRDKFDTAITAFEAELENKPDDSRLKSHFLLLAEYNQGLNKNILSACKRLPDFLFEKDLGAFFKSIQLTLNHILTWDITWLKRFADNSSNILSLEPVRLLPLPTTDGQILHKNLSELKPVRDLLDELILGFVKETNGAQYDELVRYANDEGTEFVRPLGSLMQHMFNHQTHHRGQITTMLFQLGIDPGVTDLLALVPEEK
jgi:uncharacterized damage-inducible protein DinB